MRSTNNRLRYLLVAALLVVMAAISMGAKAGAAPSKNCVGTYLVDVSGGYTQGIWTFAAGGTFQETDSAEDAFSFSHGQGAWDYAGGITKMTYLDFAVDASVPPTSLARVDAELTFSDQCQNVAGSGDLRYFAYPADPLNIIAATGGPLPFTVTGRRLVTLP